MTEPRFTKQRRAYRLDGAPVTSVTTALKVLDKPALVAWAAGASADYVTNNWDELVSLPPSLRHERVKGARFAKNKAATTKGHRIHALAEALAHGQTITVPEDLPRAGIEAYARMLDQWEMQTVATELPVANTAYLYAGTADLIVDAPRLGRVLLDAKSGKRIYDETALQLSAYRNADLRLEAVVHVGPRGGKRTELQERPMFTIDRTMGVHVQDDSVSLHPIETGPAIFEQFIRCLYLHDEWLRRTGWDYRKDATYDPPVLEPIFPEASDTDLAELPS